MATGTWLLIGTAAVLVFWSVGAYNRLSHHRDRLVRRQAEAERVLRLRRRAVAAWAAAASDGMGDTDDAPPVAAVLHACAQADAAGEGVRQSPTSRSAVSALNMAEQVLESTLRSFIRHPAAGAAAAGGRRAAWVAAEVQIVVARQVLNREVAVYNAAVGQFPASLIAATAGLRATGTLEAGTELTPAGGAPSRAAVGAAVGTAAGAAVAATASGDVQAGDAALVAPQAPAWPATASAAPGMDDAWSHRSSGPAIPDARQQPPTDAALETLEASLPAVPYPPIDASLGIHPTTNAGPASVDLRPSRDAPDTEPGEQPAPQPEAAHDPLPPPPAAVA
jgi:LemA protein